MDNSERPRLSIDIEAHIEEAQSQADTRLREALQKFLGPTPSRQERIRLQYPMRLYSPPARKPKLLLSVFAFYARELHIAEGHHYQQYPRLEIWLRKLTERIIERAMGIVVNVEQFGDGHELSLWYHGATIEEMRQTIFDEVEPLIRGRITPAPPSPPPPPEVQRQMADYAASGVDITRGSPLLQMAMATHRAATRRARQHVISPLPSPQSARPQVFAPVPPQIETPKENTPALQFAAELERLLKEARWTPEAIADEMDIDWRTVYRHRKGDAQPTLKTIWAYEEAFTKRLKRKITLPTPVKRQNVIKKSRKRQ